MYSENKFSYFSPVYVRVHKQKLKLLQIIWSTLHDQLLLSKIRGNFDSEHKNNKIALKPLLVQNQVN